MTLIDLQGHFGYLSEITVTYFSGSDRKSRRFNEGWDCRWSWVTFKGFIAYIVCRNTTYIMYKVTSCGQLFLLSYSHGTSVKRRWARRVSDS